MRRRLRSSGAITLVELAAAVTLGLPLVMTMLYAGLEADYLFTIRTNLDAATRRAAQAVLEQYYKTGSFTNVTQGNLPAGCGFDIKTASGGYFINQNANQFTVTWSLAAPPLSPPPSTVTVTAIYPNEGDPTRGIMPFPWPDPLGLSKTFGTQFGGITATATFPVDDGS